MANMQKFKTTLKIKEFVAKLSSWSTPDDTF